MRPHHFRRWLYEANPKVCRAIKNPVCVTKFENGLNESDSLTASLRRFITLVDFRKHICVPPSVQFCNLAGGWSEKPRKTREKASWGAWGRSMAKGIRILRATNYTTPQSFFRSSTFGRTGQAIERSPYRTPPRRIAGKYFP